MAKKQKKSWLERWQEPWFDNSRLDNFKSINDYINFQPKNLLDIGCGLAHEAEHFQKEYNSNIYLIDGDVRVTENNNRDINYGPVNDFRFYNKIEDLEKSYQERGLKYKFFDCNNINPIYTFDTDFDLIFSNLSCGFHYPASTYKDLILNNSTENTVMIMDFQKKYFHQQEKDIEIINVVHENDVVIKLHFKFI